MCTIPLKVNQILEWKYHPEVILGDILLSNEDKKRSDEAKV